MVVVVKWREGVEHVGSVETPRCGPDVGRWVFCHAIAGEAAAADAIADELGDVEAFVSGASPPEDS